MRLNLALSIGLLSIASAAIADESPAAEASESRAAPEHLQKTCLRETGSRIPQRHDDACLNVHGAVYSREDLEGTGQDLAGEGLWRLDPALTLHGGRSRR